MAMPITKAQYEDKKEYWDYQRKIEFNKETVFRLADQFENRVYNEFGMVDLNAMKEQLWTRVRPEDYEEPHKDWIPKDEKYRFEWEETPKVSKTKSKKVIVASKDQWENIFEELDKNIDKKSKI